MQCNVFDDFSGEVALTAGGGRRGLPLLKDTFEDVALVSLITMTEHENIPYFKIFYVPWLCNLQILSMTRESQYSDNQFL